ncbi:toprim domain-containing protein [Lelliottia nimipressuralis]|uniref:toprim domain-containing protein n=1 Tax=Lelliottia nimipressuralis TaxID=69220 RepID=UPI00289E3BD0|nr:toprim domain-containing protein [Lelliottia nimipressuralis]
MTGNPLKPMDQQVHAEAVRRLVQDFGFKERDKYLQQGLCPACNKKEMYTSIEHPYLLKCGRENKCGQEITIRSLYPDLFENWSRRFKSTPENPHAAADAYLRDGRGLDISRFKGCYKQASFVDSETGMGSATVRFTLTNGKHWERIIDEPERFGQKANFIGPYAGYWWEPPAADLVNANNIFITEGIFDALSWVQSGNCAVATLSCKNYPSMLLDKLAKAIPDISKRPRLIWAFDDDHAGRSHIIKFARRAAEEGWKVSAALPSENGGIRDWNDLLQMGRLTPDLIIKYRYYGKLLLAESPSEKALLMYQQTEAHAFPFEFDSRTYWFKLDFNKYMAAFQRIRDYDQETFSDDDAKKRALKETGAIEQIANCTLRPLYFQRSIPTDESWYYIKINLPHSPSVKGTFTSTHVASASSIKDRLLHLAKGASFSGDTKQLDRLMRSLETIKEVETQSFIGYNRDFSAWVMNSVAVSKGKVFKLNDEDYFEIHRRNVKSLSLSPQLSINTDLSEFQLDWLDDIWTAFGVKGYAALAFWFGSLFAEQIRDMHKSFPFLEISGEPNTGKSTLIEFLWKLCGRENYEGFDPSKSSPAARGRNFAQVSNLPVILMEGDRNGTDKPSKLRAFDFDELKSLYNGRASRALGIKNSGNETHEPPFRGSIVIAQNAEVDGSEALLSRIIHMFTDTSTHTNITQRAAERLEQTPISSVSGFLLISAQKETEVLQEYDQHYHAAMEEMASRDDIRHRRVIKTHSQLIGMLHALALVVPVHVDRLTATRNYILSIAAERQSTLNLDHPLVQEFWDLFDYLNAQEPFGIDHSEEKGEVAINFNHFEEMASYYRQRMPFSLSEIKKLLKGGRTREFVKSGSVRSIVSKRHNAGKATAQCKPETYHCWIFKHKTKGEEDK